MPKPTHTRLRNLRVDDDTWGDFKAVCAAEDTDASHLLREFIRSHIRAWRRRNPAGTLPSDARRPGDAEPNGGA